jgi:hypothetical protein
LQGRAIHSDVTISQNSGLALVGENLAANIWEILFGHVGIRYRDHVALKVAGVELALSYPVENLRMLLEVLQGCLERVSQNAIIQHFSTDKAPDRSPLPCVQSKVKSEKRPQAGRLQIRWLAGF